jgi:hypothetical protein
MDSCRSGHTLLTYGQLQVRTHIVDLWTAAGQDTLLTYGQLQVRTHCRLMDSCRPGHTMLTYGQLGSGHTLLTYGLLQVRTHIFDIWTAAGKDTHCVKIYRSKHPTFQLLVRRLCCNCLIAAGQESSFATAGSVTLCIISIAGQLQVGRHRC